MNTEEQLNDILNFDVQNILELSDYVYNEITKAIELIYASGDRIEVRTQLFNAVTDLDTIETLARDSKKKIREIAYKQ